MRFRDQVALTLPALILRLTLCLIFVWAGLGKILGETTVTGADAARLHNLGVALTPPVGAPAAAPTQTPPTTDAPARPLPEPTLPPTDLVTPDEPASDQPAADQPNAPASPLSMGLAEPRWIPVRLVRAPLTAADFPTEHRVQRVHGITLLLSRAADPGLDAQSRPLPRTMPAWVGADRWPVILAWTAAISELLAAFMLFFGVLTRFGALLIIGIMLQAMWLTQIGPAVMGANPTFLGFIPAPADPWSPAAYQTLFFQLTCLAMAKAVFLLGSGPIGFDRALFRPSERLERTSPNAKRRSTFDRQPTDTP
jgi:uncharacterized membrane protein YphA (DoxX/SURF4 family)